jgi:hypothetical protein
MLCPFPEHRRLSQVDGHVPSEKVVVAGIEEVERFC